MSEQDLEAAGCVDVRGSWPMGACCAHVRHAPVRRMDRALPRPQEPRKHEHASQTGRGGVMRAAPSNL